MHVAHSRISVLHWRRCDTLCTSGFVDEVTLARDKEQVKRKRRIVEVIHQGAARIWYGGVYSHRLNKGNNTLLGVESDVYDCLV